MFMLMMKGILSSITPLRCHIVVNIDFDKMLRLMSMAISLMFLWLISMMIPTILLFSLRTSNLCSLQIMLILSAKRWLLLGLICHFVDSLVVTPLGVLFCNLKLLLFVATSAVNEDTVKDEQR